MVEAKDIKTTTFRCKDGFMVDITETEDCFYAYIYHENYGVKNLMFGAAKDNMYYGKPYTETFDGFKETVEANLNNYKVYYFKDVMLDKTNV